MIVAIDLLVLVIATKQARAWQQEFPRYGDFTLSVNLSAQQLSQPQLVEFVADTLASSGLSPHSLKLEVTESGVMENPDSARDVLARLKDLGAQLLVDDFGTGYSSLSYLQRFAFDIVKIDQSFVRHMDANPRNREIIKTIVDLATRLQMGVLAEGVETAASLAEIRQLGCGFAQGYFFSKPLPPAAFADLLREQPAWQRAAPYGGEPLR